MHPQPAAEYSIIIRYARVLPKAFVKEEEE